VPRKIAADRLKQLLKLAKRKQALLAEMQNIDRRMIRLEQEFRESPRSIEREARVTFSNQGRKAARGKRPSSGGARKRGRHR